jgi:hypothetical protein
MSEHKWLRIRSTPTFLGLDGTKVCCVLGERDDGAVFYQMTHKFIEDKYREVYLEVARVILDEFLDAPLVESSIGTFEVEPNYYVPGMSPVHL